MNKSEPQVFLTLLMALERDTPGRPTSCLVFLPRTSNFFRLIFTSKGLFLISAAALVLRTLSARFFFFGAFPISGGKQTDNHTYIIELSCATLSQNFCSFFHQKKTIFYIFWVLRLSLSPDIRYKYNGYGQILSQLQIKCKKENELMMDQQTNEWLKDGQNCG